METLEEKQELYRRYGTTRPDNAFCTWFNIATGKMERVSVRKRVDEVERVRMENLRIEREKQENIERIRKMNLEQRKREELEQEFKEHGIFVKVRR